MIEGDEDEENSEEEDEEEEEIPQGKPKSNLKNKSNQIEEEKPGNNSQKERKKVTFLDIETEGMEQELDEESIDEEDEDEEENPHGFVSADKIGAFRKTKKYFKFFLKRYLFYSKFST